MASIVPINVTNILPPAININDWEFSNYTGIIKLTRLWIDKDVMKYLNYVLTTHYYNLCSSFEFLERFGVF